jgi:hypothetical protein
MPLYRVIVEGRGCLIEMEGATRRLGFFTTRFREAPEASEAATVAMASVRAELQDQLLNSAYNPPHLSIHTLEEVGIVGLVGLPNCGFTFYPDYRTRADSN